MSRGIDAAFELLYVVRDTSKFIGLLQLTSVTSDVFPEPLGPSSKMEGSVVRPLARKTNVCRKRGIVRARTMETARPSGDGFSRARTQSFTLTILATTCKLR